MFTGFGVKYPQYEVITPQTHLSFSLRSLNVQEEEKMKGSLMTPTRITDHLNKCLYDSIESKPDSIKDYDSFLRNITLKDRDALLYGLYHITYDEIRNYNVTCGNCRKEYPVTIKASSTFSFIPYPQKDILSKRIKVDLEITKGVSATIKQPTLFDESFSMKELSSRPGSNFDIIIETLIIDNFTQVSEGSTEPIKYSDKSDIIDAYLTLPARDKRIIHDSYLENFGKYGIELKMKTFCKYCSNEEIVNIDLVESFFRAIYST